MLQTLKNLLCTYTQRAFGALAIAALAGAASPVSAASIQVLVADQAEQEFGLEMPANGHFDVRIAKGLITQGELISDFWIDRKTGQFIANVVTDQGDVRRVWGLSLLTIPVPVPTHRILPDTIISSEDIDMIDMPWARVSSLSAIDIKEVTGMQVRRVLAPGRPIQRQSLTPPIVVSRGQRVTIKLTAGALKLTAAGKAIGDAHVGQEVRVVNLGSKKIIVGIARADGLVEAAY